MRLWKTNKAFRNVIWFTAVVVVAPALVFAFSQRMWYKCHPLSRPDVATSQLCEEESIQQLIEWGEPFSQLWESFAR